MVLLLQADSHSHPCPGLFAHSPRLTHQFLPPSYSAGSHSHPCPCSHTQAYLSLPSSHPHTQLAYTHQCPCSHTHAYSPLPPSLPLSWLTHVLTLSHSLMHTTPREVFTDCVHSPPHHHTLTPLPMLAHSHTLIHSPTHSVACSFTHSLLLLLSLALALALALSFTRSLTHSLARSLSLTHSLLTPSHLPGVHRPLLHWP